MQDCGKLTKLLYIRSDERLTLETSAPPFYLDNFSAIPYSTAYLIVRKIFKPDIRKCIHRHKAVKMSSQVRRPFVRVNLVHRLLKMLYNFQDIMEVRELSSFSDRNFYILGRRCESCCSESQNNIAVYVLKVLNSVDSVAGDFIDAENNAMMFLRSRGFPCPLLVRVSDTTSQLKALVQIPLLDDHDAKLVQDNTVKNRSSPNTENCILRLMSFLPGVTASSQKLSEKDLFYVGQFVGQLSLTLQV